jgi:hypothetical protein
LRCGVEVWRAHEKDDRMTIETPEADAMYTQVVTSLREMDLAGIAARVHAQLTRLDDRKIFDAVSKDASRDDLVHLAARTIVRARLATRPPSNHPTSR